MSSSLALSSVLLVVGLVAGVGAGVVIWQQTRGTDEAAQASPSPLATDLAVVIASPAASPAAAGTTTPESPAPTWWPVRATTASPSPIPAQRAARPSPTVASATATSARITWVDLPSSVASGERFTVRWRIDGPAGARGEKTTLQVVYETAQDSNGSTASTSSNSSNSFGPFTVPATFDSQFSFGSAPATIHVTVTARVAGQDISRTAAIPLR